MNVKVRALVITFVMAAVAAADRAPAQGIIVPRDVAICHEILTDTLNYTQAVTKESDTIAYVKEGSIVVLKLDGQYHVYGGGVSIMPRHDTAPYLAQALIYAVLQMRLGRPTTMEEAFNKMYAMQTVIGSNLRKGNKTILRAEGLGFIAEKDRSKLAVRVVIYIPGDK